MKLTLITLLLLNTLFLSYSNANEVIGSLESRLKTSSADTTRIELLLQMGDQFEHTDYESAHYYYVKALEATRNALEYAENSRVNDRLNELEALSIRYLAFLEMNWAQYEAATALYYELLEIYKSHEFYLGITRVLTSLGNIMYYQSELVKAIEYYNNALEMAAENGFTKQTADLNTNIASIYFLRGDYIRSLEHYQKALPYYNELDDERNKGLVYLGLGNIYNALGNFERALENYNNALIFFDKLEDNRSIATISISLGTLFFNHDNYAEAKNFFNDALHHSKMGSDKRQEAQSYLNLGVLHAARENHETAIEHYNKILSDESLSQYRHIRTSVLLNKATLQKRNNNFERAHYLINKGLALAEEIEALEDLAEAYRILSEINEERGRYRQSLKDFRQYKLVNDSILGIETQRQLNELDARFSSEQEIQAMELEKLEMEKNKLEIQRKNSFNNLIFIILIFAVVLVIAFLVHFNQKRIDNLLINKQKDIIKNRQDKNDELSAKLNKQQQENSSLKETMQELRQKQTENFEFTRFILNNGCHCNMDIQSVFSGRAFESPIKLNNQFNDLCNIKKDNEHVLITIADVNLDKFHKTLLNISLNSFIDNHIEKAYYSKPEVCILSIYEHLNDMLEYLFSKSKSMKLSLASMYINTKTQKVKFVSEDIYLCLAIARNPSTIFKPILDYQDIQLLEPLQNTFLSDGKENNPENIYEFTLKSNDRVYMFNINNGSISEDKMATSKDALTIDLINFLDKHQNMEISLQGEYLEKEITKQYQNETIIPPQKVIIRGIEM